MRPAWQCRSGRLWWRTGVQRWRQSGHASALWTLLTTWSTLQERSWPLCSLEAVLGYGCASLCFSLGKDDAPGHVQTWLERFVRVLSENSIRVLLARVTNKLTLPRPGQTITFELISAAEQPRFFPVARHMQLPQCTSFEAFASRMGVALRLGENMSRTGAQNEQRLTRDEERAVVAALGGEPGAGGLLLVYLWVHLRCGRVQGANAKSALP